MGEEELYELAKQSMTDIDFGSFEDFQEALKVDGFRDALNEELQVKPQSSPQSIDADSLYFEANTKLSDKYDFGTVDDFKEALKQDNFQTAVIEEINKVKSTRLDSIGIGVTHEQFEEVNKLYPKDSYEDKQYKAVLLNSPDMAESLKGLEVLRDGDNVQINITGDLDNKKIKSHVDSYINSNLDQQKESIQFQLNEELNKKLPDLAVVDQLNTDLAATQYKKNELQDKFTKEDHVKLEELKSKYGNIAGLDFVQLDEQQNLVNSPEFNEVSSQIKELQEKKKNIPKRVPITQRGVGLNYEEYEELKVEVEEENPIDNFDGFTDINISSKVKKHTEPVLLKPVSLEELYPKVTTDLLVDSAKSLKNPLKPYKQPSNTDVARVARVELTKISNEINKVEEAFYDRLSAEEKRVANSYKRTGQIPDGFEVSTEFKRWRSASYNKAIQGQYNNEFVDSRAKITYELLNTIRKAKDNKQDEIKAANDFLDNYKKENPNDSDKVEDVRELFKESEDVGVRDLGGIIKKGTKSIGLGLVGDAVDLTLNALDVNPDFSGTAYDKYVATPIEKAGLNWLSSGEAAIDYVKNLFNFDTTIEASKLEDANYKIESENIRRAIRNELSNSGSESVIPIYYNYVEKDNNRYIVKKNKVVQKLDSDGNISDILPGELDNIDTKETKRGYNPQGLAQKTVGVAVEMLPYLASGGTFAGVSAVTAGSMLGNTYYSVLEETGDSDVAFGVAALSSMAIGATSKVFGGLETAMGRGLSENATRRFISEEFKNYGISAFRGQQTKTFTQTLYEYSKSFAKNQLKDLGEEVVEELFLENIATNLVRNGFGLESKQLTMEEVIETVATMLLPTLGFSSLTKGSSAYTTAVRSAYSHPDLFDSESQKYIELADTEAERAKRQLEYEQKASDIDLYRKVRENGLSDSEFERVLDLKMEERVADTPEKAQIAKQKVDEAIVELNEKIRLKTEEDKLGGKNKDEIEASGSIATSQSGASDTAGGSSDPPATLVGPLTEEEFDQKQAEVQASFEEGRQVDIDGETFTIKGDTFVNEDKELTYEDLTDKTVDGVFFGDYKTYKDNFGKQEPQKTETQPKEQQDVQGDNSVQEPTTTKKQSDEEIRVETENLEKTINRVEIDETTNYGGLEEGETYTFNKNDKDYVYEGGKFHYIRVDGTKGAALGKARTKELLKQVEEGSNPIIKALDDGQSVLEVLTKLEQEKGSPITVEDLPNTIKNKEQIVEAYNKRVELLDKKPTSQAPTEQETTQPTSSTTNEEKVADGSQTVENQETSSSQGELKQTSRPKAIFNSILDRLKSKGLAKSVSLDQEGFDSLVGEGRGLSRVGLRRKVQEYRKKARGFIRNGKIAINPDSINEETLIHEFGHLWLEQLKLERKDLWEKGKELVGGSDIHKRVVEESKQEGNLYNGKREEELLEEALVTLIGESGDRLVDKAESNSISEWLNNFWSYIKESYGIKDLTVKEVSNLTLEQFAELSAIDLLKDYNETSNTTNEINENAKLIDEYGFTDSGIVGDKAKEIEPDGSSKLAKAMSAIWSNVAKAFGKTSSELVSSIGRGTPETLKNKNAKYSIIKGLKEDSKLKLAETMEEDGASSESIFNATGHIKVDGEWFYETGKLELKKDIKPGKYKASQILSTKGELFKVYPQLKEVNIKIEDEQRSFNSDDSISPTDYDDSSKTITIRVDAAREYNQRKSDRGLTEDENLLSIISHELQHSIQSVEGRFDKNSKGKSEQFREAVKRAHKKMVEQFPSEYKTADGGDRLFEQLSRVWQHFTYSSKPIEIEARVSQLREVDRNGFIGDDFLNVERSEYITAANTASERGDLGALLGIYEIALEDGYTDLKPITDLLDANNVKFSKENFLDSISTRVETMRSMLPIIDKLIKSSTGKEKERLLNQKREIVRLIKDHSTNKKVEVKYSKASHFTTKDFKYFSDAALIGRPRSKYGWGHYFTTNFFKGRGYGAIEKSIESDEFNLIDYRATVDDALYQQLKNGDNSSLISELEKEILYLDKALDKVRNNRDYDRILALERAAKSKLSLAKRNPDNSDILKVIKNNLGKTVDEVRREVLNSKDVNQIQDGMFLEERISKTFLKAGIDGIDVSDGAGNKGYEIVIFNTPKLNTKFSKEQDQYYAAAIQSLDSTVILALTQAPGPKAFMHEMMGHAPELFFSPEQKQFILDSYNKWARENGKPTVKEYNETVNIKGTKEPVVSEWFARNVEEFWRKGNDVSNIEAAKGMSKAEKGKLQELFDTITEAIQGVAKAITQYLGSDIKLTPEMEQFIGSMAVGKNPTNEQVQNNQTTDKRNNDSTNESIVNKETETNEGGPRGDNNTNSRRAVETERIIDELTDEEIDELISKCDL